MRAQVQRSGFTLVELLVVIAIIAILVALTSAAVYEIFIKTEKVTTQHEISQMANGLEMLRHDFKLKGYPPSTIFLCNDVTQYTAQSKTDSLRFLNRMFPQINWGSVNWGVPGAATGVELEGHQALVFWLGGIPSANGPLGFSKVPSNPTDTTSVERYGPYFDFNVRRIAGSPPHYLDGFGDPGDPTSKPYAYFSSGNRQNGYSNDCPSLGVAPYKASSIGFINPRGFQIISAGRDKTFGSGGNVWSTANPNPEGAGFDDFSNFSGLQLGIGGG